MKPERAPLTTEHIYALWEKSGYFNPDKLPKRHTTPFTIIMPPPNANGSLHAGHALFVTLEDIMIRFRRMQGYRTLWLPGADHAGFETQIVYEKVLEKQGRSRFDLSREELFKEILAFTLENKKRMEDQLRKLGASCDWSRARFTLDHAIVSEAQKTFKALFDDGLVYRGKRPVNWCTKHQTSLSDLETNSESVADKLYYLKYGPITVATVRPETIFGDVAIAVHPKDARYMRHVGTTIEVQIPGKRLSLTVIADESVDPKFGTGALKITPAHDASDFETGLRHGLPAFEVIDERGRMNAGAGKYAGMKALEARAAVVRDLEEMSMIERVEEYSHEVPICYKCRTVIEPRVMNQWFVRVGPLAERAVRAVRKREVRFVSKRFEKIFFGWMSRLRDWNISRQIVWGSPIPAKICEACGEGVPDLANKIRRCPACGGGVRAETDTFDTWFSSGQWPFLALGYPKSKDFKTFYPTDVMETGYDILFFWVSRMIMLGLYRTGRIPFTHVYLHGLVNDATGTKMSKSKGNVINPIEICEKYGADALRMALVVGNAPGNDTALSEDKIRGYRNFVTKMRNAARFVLMNFDERRTSAARSAPSDTRALNELARMKKAVTKDIEAFRYHEASQKLYRYFWHTFADKIIERAKPRLKEPKSEADRASAQETLMKILAECVKMLHPFMPFTTEEIYQSLPKTVRGEKTLMVEAW
ncbi:MAG: valine--tRNA ligase [Candidatus Colwellbacteria bacterium]|nr:valine--tRNA ligase [Candidatus Colwellbacteria bacterium]